MMNRILACILLSVAGCDRQQRETEVPRSQATENVADISGGLSSPSDLGMNQDTLPVPGSWDVAALIKDIAEGGSEAQGNAISKMRALAPALLQEDLLATTMQRIPEPQRAPFLDLLPSVFSRKRDSGEFDTEYITSVMLLNNTPFQPESALLLEDLDRVPPYAFPDETPNPWDAANAVHNHKGYPGLLALALVARSDPETRKAYREKLERTDGALRRVMLWALGRSTAEEDFSYLLALFESARDDEKNRIAKSLNRIPIAIEESLILDPPVNASADARVSLVGELREQLESKDAVVELGPWD